MVQLYLKPLDAQGAGGISRHTLVVTPKIALVGTQWAHHPDLVGTDPDLVGTDPNLVVTLSRANASNA